MHNIEGSSKFFKGPHKFCLVYVIFVVNKNSCFSISCYTKKLITQENYYEKYSSENSSFPFREISFEYNFL